MQGRRFGGDHHPETLTAYRSAMLLEVVLAQCVQFIRSYYPTLEPASVTADQLRANRQVRASYRPTDRYRPVHVYNGSRLRPSHLFLSDLANNLPLSPDRVEDDNEDDNDGELFIFHAMIKMSLMWKLWKLWKNVEVAYVVADIKKC